MFKFAQLNFQPFVLSSHFEIFFSRFIGVIRGEVGCSTQGCSDCQIRLTSLKGFTLYYARQ